MVTLVILILQLSVELFGAFLLGPSLMVVFFIVFNVLVSSPKHEALEGLLMKEIVQNRVKARTHLLLEILDLVHFKEQFCPSKHGSGFLLVEGSNVGLKILDGSVNI